MSSTATNRLVRVRMEFVVELGPAENYSDPDDVKAQVIEDMDADGAMFFGEQMLTQDIQAVTVLSGSERPRQDSNPQLPG